MSARPRPADLARLARTPKWIGLGVMLLAFIVLAGLAGQWQWSRTMEVLEAERAAQSQPVPISDVLVAGEELPGGAIGQPVTVVGQYAAADQVVVLHRSLDGKPGVWVVTPLDLVDGTRVLVLRGWLPDGESPGVTPPQGEVTVTGVLQPDERFYPDARPEPGTAVAISSERLAQGWSAPTLSGFVALSEQSPAPQDAPAPVPPTVQTADVPFPLRNFGYAVQWFVFALFGALVYLRWLWLDAVRANESDEEKRATTLNS